MSITCPHCGKTFDLPNLRYAMPKKERISLMKSRGHKAELEFTLYLEKQDWVVRVNSTPISSVPCYPDIYASHPSGKEYYFEVKSTSNRFGRIEAKQIKTILKPIGFFGSYIEQKAYVAVNFLTFKKWVVKNVSEPKTMTVYSHEKSDAPFENPKVPEIENWDEYLKTWFEWHKKKEEAELIEFAHEEKGNYFFFKRDKAFQILYNDVCELGEKLQRLLEANL